MKEGERPPCSVRQPTQKGFPFSPGPPRRAHFGLPFALPGRTMQHHVGQDLMLLFYQVSAAGPGQALPATCVRSRCPCDRPSVRPALPACANRWDVVLSHFQLAAWWARQRGAAVSGRASLRLGPSLTLQSGLFLTF